MSNIKILFILSLLILIGGFLRFYNNVYNPVSLNIDEVSIGYNAYSILKTGRDEHGVFLPFSFKSVGDYKPPVLIYLTVPFIAVFGLNDFAVRFPVALISTISILIIYFFIKELSGNKTYALISSLLLTISPWHIYFSRYATEALVALTFLILGSFCFLKMIKGKWVWSFFTALLLSLSMYTYHAERLFIPLMVFVLILFNFKKFLYDKKKIIIFVLCLLLFSLPLFISIIFGQDKIRAQSTFITTDIVFHRQVLNVNEVGNLKMEDYPLLFFYWARKYLNYFQPSFLFFNGLNLTTPGTYGLGIVYLFELPFLILGLVYLVRNKIQNGYLIPVWIILGLLPASLTNNEQHALRSLLILPMVIFISALGFNSLLKKLKNLRSALLRRSAIILFLIFIIWNLSYAWIIYTVHFSKQQGEAFMEGTKETVEYALFNKSKYDKIIFDPVRGIQGPYISSIPHEYVLFYSKYDPLTFQKESKISNEGFFVFDKFEFRSIDWSKDKNKKNTLLIGSPWSLPAKDLKDDEILQRVYLSNGKLAFLIVSPK